jgi:RNA-directed DNA polymerase
LNPTASKGAGRSWKSEGLIVPTRPVKVGGGKGPWFWCASDGAEGEEIGVSLTTPEKIRMLQRKLYKKAKREPEFRFYLLYDKVYRPDILEFAYRRCRANRGASGVDGETFEKIESAGTEGWLRDLGEDVRTERYRPKPVRRVMIPKPGGGQRPLGIPCIRDRVVQMAAKLVLEPIFEADFEESAYGYRPRRSAQGAVGKVLELLRSGYTEVVDADLSGYFDTIPHAELMRSMARRVVDCKMLRLVKMWLKAPVEERNGETGRTRLTGGKRSKRGTPQGGVLSPLLANVYMRRLLLHFVQSRAANRFDARIVNYADDLVIVSRGHGPACLGWLKRSVTGLGLTLNETKTCIRNGRQERFDFLGYTFGPMYSRRLRGYRYTGMMPSKKALQRLRMRVREILGPWDQRPWSEVVAELNRVIRGWTNYFSLGTRTQTYRAAEVHIRERVRYFLRRRHKVADRGNRRFSQERVFGELGVISPVSRLRVTPSHALS